MRLLNSKLFFIACAFLIFLLGKVDVLCAGGPFIVDQKGLGVPMRWQGDKLEWYADEGRLTSTISNDTAKQWIQELFNKWTGAKLTNKDRQLVGTSVVTVEFKGGIGGDVKSCKPAGATDDDRDPCGEGEMDYPSIVDNDADMRTVVIFDEDGSIITDLGYNKDDVVGLSAPTYGSDDGLKITKGFAVMSGYLLSTGRLTEDEVKAAMLHELGHLLNLDHSQVNSDDARLCNIDAACEAGNVIPTMFPNLVSGNQQILSYDDIIAISWIYPSQDFNDDFCTITGNVFDSNGNPLKGVNIVAMRADEGDWMAKADARSFVSGVLKAGCNGSNDQENGSTYYLHGIVPGHKYQVIYEPVDTGFTGASDLEPLGATSPKGFTRGNIQTPSGETTVSCDEGGKTIEMASISIPGSATTCTQSVNDEPPSSSASSKCSLNPGAAAADLSIFFLFLAAVAVYFYRWHGRQG